MSTPPSPPTPLTVLIVDDEPVMLRAARRVLPDHFVVETAGDGHEALKMLAARRYDVLIADHFMPGIFGIELLERARAMHEDIVGLLVTGSAEQAAQLDLRRFQMLIKPFDRASLLETIDRGLEQAQRKRERAQARAARTSGTAFSSLRKKP